MHIIHAMLFIVCVTNWSYLIELTAGIINIVETFANREQLENGAEKADGNCSCFRIFLLSNWLAWWIKEFKKKNAGHQIAIQFN